MKLQRFVGKNTKSVLDEIRTILGDEALIVSNMKVGSKTEIIAASDAKKSDSDNLDVTYSDKQTNTASEESFTNVLNSQKDEKCKDVETSGMDPWAHIKNINEEIRSIKSSLNQLPAIKTAPEQNIGQASEEEEQKVTTEDPLHVLDKTSQGCHIVWGERKSGKSFLIKELIKRRASKHGETSIFRLPHASGNSDSHLSAIAAKHSLNLFLLNQLETIESMTNLFGDDRLIFIEADLSVLASLAAKNDVSWLAKSANYIIDEDAKQTELIAELFQKFKADVPTAVSSSIIEQIS